MGGNFAAETKKEDYEKSLFFDGSAPVGGVRRDVE